MSGSLDIDSKKKSSANNSRRRKILVVEPDSGFRGALADFLSAERFEVESAQEGDEAIRLFTSFGPDLVLLCRELPLADGGEGPDGLRVLKVIKQNHRSRRTAVILYSGTASDKDFERYRRLKFSADDYLKKPFEDTDLLRRVENLVGFDLSDDLDEIHARIADVMDDPLANIFDAAPEELGSSAATRKEVTRLLEQMGAELDRQDFFINGDAAAEPAPEQEPAGRKAPPPAGEKKPAGLAAERERRQQEIQSLSRQLDLAQGKLVSERKRSREIKREWKVRLQEIASQLAESEERESLVRDEFEKMRERVADLELDHTMELERVNAEKRRLEEDLLRLREQSAVGGSSEDLRAELKKAAAIIRRLLSRLDEKSE